MFVNGFTLFPMFFVLEKFVKNKKNQPIIIKKESK